MPPKAAVNVDSLDEASVKFILSTLKSCSEFAPDWNQVAKENKIKYSKNARPRFNTIVSKFGFKLEDKKIVQLEQDDTEDTDAAVSTPKKAGKPKQIKTPASKKRRKMGEDEDEEAMSQVKEGSGDDIGANGSGDAETV